MSKPAEIKMLPSEGLPPLDSATNLVLNLLAQESNAHDNNVISLPITHQDAGKCNDQKQPRRPLYQKYKRP